MNNAEKLLFLINLDLERAKDFISSAEKRIEKFMRLYGKELKDKDIHDFETVLDYLTEQGYFED